MIELVRAGRDPANLAREFEPSAQAIRNWVMQADLAEGRREKPAVVFIAAEGSLPASERDELARLRREVRQLRVERDILSNQRGSRSACGGRNGQAYGSSRR